MKLLDVFWTPTINKYQVECDCGEVFSHRVDRWRIRCPWCSRSTDVEELRAQELPGDA